MYTTRSYTIVINLTHIDNGKEQFILKQHTVFNKTKDKNGRQD